MTPLGSRQSTTTDTGIRWWPHSSPDEGGIPNHIKKLRDARQKGQVGVNHSCPVDQSIFELYTQASSRDSSEITERKKERKNIYFSTTAR
jgi:hypothetical protein